MRPSIFRAATATAALLLSASAVFADVTAAKSYVKEAEELVDSRNSSDLEKAQSKIELAEAELDGVAADAKAPVAAQIQAAKAKLAASLVAVDKPKYTRMLDRAMSEAEGDIGNLAVWPTAERMWNELYADPKAKMILGADLEAAAKKFATFKKLNAKKSAVQYVEQLTNQVTEVETKWVESKKELTDPDASPNGKESEINSMTRDLSEARKRITAQLGDDESAKPLIARLDKVSAEFTKIALAGRVKDVAVTLHRKMDVYKDDFDGWEKETTGPTYEEYRSKQTEAMSRFLCPKTAIFVMRTDDLLKDLDKDEDYTSVAADPSIKTIVDDLKAKRKTAYEKLVKIVTAVVADAEKAGEKETNKLDNLESNVRLTLGETSPEGLVIREKLKGKSAAVMAATTGAEEAKVKLVADLRKKAEAEWPGLYAGMSFVVDVDLSNPEKFVGQNIGFLSDNLMGWRFKPGDFYFATTIGGFPVAAKIDPQLMTQIKATEKAIGRSLGDDDGDGKWDVIAVMTDRKVKLMARKQTEGTVKVDGGADIKVTAEYAEPVDAFVIEIIAAKCGPFAGAKGRGVLKEDGTIAK